MKPKGKTKYVVTMASGIQRTVEADDRFYARVAAEDEAKAEGKRGKGRKVVWIDEAKKGRTK